MPLREVPLEPKLRMQIQSKETIRTCLLGALAGGKKQAEFRTGLTQTGPKPACFLNSLPYIGLYSITCDFAEPFSSTCAHYLHLIYAVRW